MVYLLLALSAAGVVLLCVRKRYLEISFGLIGPLVFITMVCANALNQNYAAGNYSHMNEMVFSSVALALGVVTMVYGVRNESFGRLNGGILLICAWLIAKFFNNDMSLLAKGALFIGLGVTFIVFNIIMVQRRRKTAGKAVAA